MDPTTCILRRSDSGITLVIIGPCSPKIKITVQAQELNLQQQQSNQVLISVEITLKVNIFIFLGASKSMMKKKFWNFE
jgi:hypothetical protein